MEGSFRPVRVDSVRHGSHIELRREALWSLPCTKVGGSTCWRSPCPIRLLPAIRSTPPGSPACLFQSPNALPGRQRVLPPTLRGGGRVRDRRASAIPPPGRDPARRAYPNRSKDRHDWPECNRAGAGAALGRASGRKGGVLPASTRRARGRPVIQDRYSRGMCARQPLEHAARTPRPHSPPAASNMGGRREHGLVEPGLGWVNRRLCGLSPVACGDASPSHAPWWSGSAPVLISLTVRRQ
jgi:hypothetical protein